MYTNYFQDNQDTDFEIYVNRTGNFENTCVILAESKNI